MTRNFVESLIAVLAGNALYFSLLPQLPEGARHHPQHIDLGLLLDFWLCLVLLACIRALGKHISGRPRL